MLDPSCYKPNKLCDPGDKHEPVLGKHWSREPWRSVWCAALMGHHIPRWRHAGDLFVRDFFAWWISVKKWFLLKTVWKLALHPSSQCVLHSRYKCPERLFSHADNVYFTGLVPSSDLHYISSSLSLSLCPSYIQNPDIDNICVHKVRFSWTVLTIA